MQKTKTFLAVITLIAMAASPFLVAYADDSTAPVTPSQTTDTIVVTASEAVASPDVTVLDTTATIDTTAPVVGSDMTNELAFLQATEQDPSTGFWAKIWIGLKIKEIENQINVANALQ